MAPSELNGFRVKQGYMATSKGLIVYYILRMLLNSSKSPFCLESRLFPMSQFAMADRFIGAMDLANYSPNTRQARSAFYAPSHLFTKHLTGKERVFHVQYCVCSRSRSCMCRAVAVSDERRLDGIRSPCEWYLLQAVRPRGGWRIFGAFFCQRCLSARTPSQIE